MPMTLSELVAIKGMISCAYPNCETTVGCRGTCHEAKRAKAAPGELIQLADWIRDGKLTFIHCGTLGAMDASAEQHDRIEAALRLAATVKAGERDG